MNTSQPMLKSWLTFRHISSALKEGRLEEAWHLLKEPAIRRQEQAKEYLLRCGIAFLARAKQLGKQNNLTAAMKDLTIAQEAGVEETTIALVKTDLLDHKLAGVNKALNQGQPAQALTLIDALRQQRVALDQLEPLEQLARAWLIAKEQAQRGEFSQALLCIERINYQDVPALKQLHAQWRQHQQKFPALCDQLHQAVQQQHWRQVVKLADELLALAPEHAEVRTARAKAWKVLEPPTVIHAPNKPVEQVKPVPVEAPKEEETPRRLLCWIDGVGGYLLCLSPRVSLGRATGDATVDIPLFADVSRLHAYLSRDSEGGYVLEAVRPVQLNGKNVEKAVLKDGDELSLGSACKLRFRQPLAVSGTARLELVSRHRLPLSIDGVLLMADACLMGDNTGTHVTVPGLTRPLALVRAGEGLAVQCAGPFEIDGKACKGRAPLTMKSTVTADEMRLKLEPVGARFQGK
ncbi:MAG: FHA domain-containing protein [Gemmatales bacterium]